MKDVNSPCTAYEKYAPGSNGPYGNTDLMKNSRESVQRSEKVAFSSQPFITLHGY